MLAQWLGDNDPNTLDSFMNGCDAYGCIEIVDPILNMMQDEGDGWEQCNFMQESYYGVMYYT